jgi:hypothetical protein
MGVAGRDMGVVLPRLCGGWISNAPFALSSKSFRIRLSVIRFRCITGIVPFTNPNTHSMGGKASMEKLTPAQRVEKARAAIAVRWNKVKKLKRAA